jgi:hypothetical protein
MVMVCQVKVYKTSWNFKNKGTTTKMKQEENKLVQRGKNKLNSVLPNPISSSFLIHFE